MQREHTTSEVRGKVFKVSHCIREQITLLFYTIFNNASRNEVLVMWQFVFYCKSWYEWRYSISYQFNTWLLRSFLYDKEWYLPNVVEVPEENWGILLNSWRKARWIVLQPTIGDYCWVFLNHILCEIDSLETQGHGTRCYKISMADFNLLIANYKFISTIRIIDEFHKIDHNYQRLSKLSYSKQPNFPKIINY